MSPHQVRQLIKTIARTALALTPLLPNARRRTLAWVGLGGVAIGAAAGAIAASPELRRRIRDLAQRFEPAPPPVAQPAPNGSDHGAWVQDIDE